MAEDRTKVKVEICTTLAGYDPPGTIVEVDPFRAKRWIENGIATVPQRRAERPAPPPETTSESSPKTTSGPPPKKEASPPPRNRE